MRYPQIQRGRLTSPPGDSSAKIDALPVNSECMMLTLMHLEYTMSKDNHNNCVVPEQTDPCSWRLFRLDAPGDVLILKYLPIYPRRYISI